MANDAVPLFVGSFRGAAPPQDSEESVILKQQLRARAKRRVQRFADEKPGTAIAVAASVAVAVGVGVWLVVRANLER